MGGRYKSFDATGVAPNGKLFAGDLNAIQDMKADSSDFGQTIDLGTLRIGETGLSLTRFGAGEAQIAGNLRVTKILRGLEGIVPGAFTTAQRDAIAAGKAPYGMAILNSEKNIWEWNAGSDPARSWVPFGSTSGFGTLSARPAANAVTPGSTYFATDQVVEYISDGSTWLRKSTPAGGTLAWFSAVVPTGWVKYDGSNLPSATGIYADLAAHLGGVATPDTRGRAIYGQGTHPDVDAILDNDGLAVGSRRPRHKHVVNDPGHVHTAHLWGHGGTEEPVYGAADNEATSFGNVALNSAFTGITIGPQTGAEPTDGPPHTTGLFIAKL